MVEINPNILVQDVERMNTEYTNHRQNIWFKILPQNMAQIMSYLVNWIDCLRKKIIVLPLCYPRYQQCTQQNMCDRICTVQPVPQVYLILLLQIKVEGISRSVVAKGPLPLPAQFIV